ncbi:MAG: hypothetical protein PVG45_03000 [Gammaproteobacteria bacterium]|jgi:hypothetical protein
MSAVSQWSFALPATIVNKTRAPYLQFQVSLVMILIILSGIRV